MEIQDQVERDVHRIKKSQSQPNSLLKLRWELMRWVSFCDSLSLPPQKGVLSGLPQVPWSRMSQATHPIETP